MKNCAGFVFDVAKLYYHVRIMVFLVYNMNLSFTLLSLSCDVAVVRLAAGAFFQEKARFLKNVFLCENMFFQIGAKL